MRYIEDYMDGLGTGLIAGYVCGFIAVMIIAGWLW